MEFIMGFWLSGSIDLATTELEPSGGCSVWVMDWFLDSNQSGRALLWIPILVSPSSLSSFWAWGGGAVCKNCFSKLPCSPSPISNRTPSLLLCAFNLSRGFWHDFEFLYKRLETKTVTMCTTITAICLLAGRPIPLSVATKRKEKERLRDVFH